MRPRIRDAYGRDGFSPDDPQEWRQREEELPLRSDRAPQRDAGERFIEREDDHDGSELSLRVGQSVEHKKFGVGKLVDLGRGPDPTATVKFPGWPIKQIKLRYLAPA
jgi:hypothetical protein